MRAGKLLYKYFYKPTLPLRYNLSHFGLKGTIRIRLGEREMKKAAKKEPTIMLNNGAGLPVFCFLTGQNYWHQTVYVIKSIYRQLGGDFRGKIFSDGSLTEEHKVVFKRFAPDIEIVDLDTVSQRLDEMLPRSQFPMLHFLREWHPVFRRMIDIHCYIPGWSIHLDSDMLFFFPPNEFIDAFNNKKAIYMKDMLSNSYYSDNEEVLREKLGITCLDRVNGGIIAYNADLVDYVDLEQKTRSLMDQYKHLGPGRFEQTMMSYLLYRQNAVALDDDLYKIYYGKQLDAEEAQIVRHYIFKAKLPYLTTEWKKFRH